MFWETLGDADSGSAYSAPNLPDKTVQITGTHGGATTVIQGSNDGVTWDTLKDINGNDLSFTTTFDTRAIAENPRYIRPTTSGGSGTDLDVTIIAQSSRR